MITTQQAPPNNDKEFESVQGLDAETVRLKRAYEAEVERKVASDYTHIIWSYGILWALFAAYGLVLWRKARRLAADADALRQQIRAR